MPSITSARSVEESIMTLHAPPFTIIACAGFAGEIASPWSGAPVQVNVVGGLEQALAEIRPTLFLDMPERLCPEGGLSLKFERFADFSPAGLLSSQPYLQDLMAAVAFLREAAGKHLPDSDRQEYFDRRPHLPRAPRALQTMTDDRSPSAAPGPGPLDNLLAMVDIPEKGPETPGVPDAGAFYDQLAHTIVKRISRDRRFRSLEAAWLGLHFLKEHISDDAIRLSLIPVNESNLQQSLVRQRDNLLEKPPSLLLFDLPFDSSSRSMELLGDLASCADTLMTPAVAWITPSFFHCTDWQQLDSRPFLPHYLDDAAYAVFRKLRKTPAAAWLCLCCNRLLGRTLINGFDEVEESSPAAVLPWIAPVWGVAALIAQRIAVSGMPTGMAQPRHNQLETITRTTAASKPAVGCEAVFPEHRVEQLLRCGIVPLVPLVRQGGVFMADDRMLAHGASASSQFMLSLLVHCLLTLQDQGDYRAGREQLATVVADDLRRLLAERCRSDPGIVTVHAEDASSGHGTPLHITWQPAETIVGPKDAIELQILW